MFDLFGAEMPLAVRFFLAFLIVLGLIGAAAWAVRQFGSARLGGAVRGRQPRLAVIEYATVDARRRLLLVRRDNIEHLVMIGGPTDVVVESNIVRAVPASREAAIPRVPPPAEPMPRSLPLPEEAPNGSWPLQPEPPAPPLPQRRAPRIDSLPEEHGVVPPQLTRKVSAAAARSLERACGRHCVTCDSIRTAGKSDPAAHTSCSSAATATCRTARRGSYRASSRTPGPATAGCDRALRSRPKPGGDGATS